MGAFSKSHHLCLPGILGLLAAAALWVSTSVAAEQHPWLPPYGLDRVGQGEAAFQAAALAHAEPLTNPVDLGAILAPHEWLLIGPEQNAVVTVAALSRDADEAETYVRAAFLSDATQSVTTPLPLKKGERAEQKVKIPALPAGRDRDTLRLTIERATNQAKSDRPAVLWQKEIPVMIVREPPQWPRFGATRTKLRYDAPISVRKDDGTFTTLDYDKAWAEELDDVVVSLPDGERFVFWRGASYVPFWAGKHNTGLSYEWAETTPPKDGFADCVEPLMDKELRYGRVEIVESTPARVRVRWSYQSCDFLYKVWGDTAVEEFCFYPDGLGTRTLTLQSAPDGDYELSEFIILTPQGAYPFEVLPKQMVDILFLDGERRELTLPYFQEEQGHKLESRGQPAIYRVRLHREEPKAAIYFHPGDLNLPPVVFGPFSDKGQIVTPCYWGSHWPLARGQTTGGAINDRIHASPAHNSVMSWARQRPGPLRQAYVQTIDSLGRSRPMVVQTWTWLIGLTDTDDARLIDVARSFSSPTAATELEGARLDDEPFVQERRALRLVADETNLRVTLNPQPVTVNPVIEIRGAGDKLAEVALNGQAVERQNWSWDGQTLWLNVTIRAATQLSLQFSE